MLEELRRRNYNPDTIRGYLHAVEQFAAYFHKSPELLGIDDIGRFQLHLLDEKHLALGTIALRMGALRFLYKRVLKRRDLDFENLPLLRTPKKLPVILSPDEVTRLIEAAPNLLYRTLLMLLYATGLRRADPKHIGAEIGFLSVLHTWGQTLQPHPHIHCVVPGGGLSPDHQHWIRAPNHFFLPVRVLSRVFRGKFVAGLRRVFRQDKLAFFGTCESLSHQKAFSAFLRTLYREDWIVYAKKPFGGPEHVLHYLARYTHRVAISNHRIVDVTDAQVAFRWKDYAHHSKRRTMTLTHEEFLRRFLQHVLPRGFPRIRYFGLFANRRRGALLPLCRALLAIQPPSVQTTVAAAPALWLCPRCQGSMRVIERLSANALRWEESRLVQRLDSS
jgi:hypothetical protein